MTNPVPGQVMNHGENVEQFERKRHTEMDNIAAVAQWQESVRNLPGKLLDPDKAIDVMKYAAILGDPRRPRDVPQWLAELLRAVSSGSAMLVSMERKLAAVTQKKVTRQFLTQKKVALVHPQIKVYADLALRHRFLRGFCAEARQRLHEKVVVEMGRRGLASRPFPLARAVLMDPSILSSDAFTTSREKEEVPAWRDGNAGKALQQRMADYAAKRFWDYDFHSANDTKSSIFSSGPNWVGFSRLAHHVEAVLENVLGVPGGWPDSAACLRREMWRGDHDAELARLSIQFPAGLDNAPAQMQARLKEPRCCMQHVP